MDVLIVDDEPNIRRAVRALLESEGWRVREADRGASALERIAEEEPEVVLLDLALPGPSGLELLPRIEEAAPGVPVVMMSGQATLSDAVQATRRGALHFLEKPLTPEAVLVTLRGALEIRRARDLSRALQEELGPGARLVGVSEAISTLSEQVRRVAATDARVLVTGESGTGKELVATAIHALSPRKSGPFVRVNSAAIPTELVESEMFGHERGAFTGATERRRGRFELAHRGTLFLDEVADLGAGAQAKLLRVLEAGEIERVGGSRPIEVDVRVVAATNRDLREEVREGRFREDLLFRLEVVPLFIPPLRERPEDVEPLVRHAVDRLRVKHGLPAPEFDGDAMVALRGYRWPGNVRELFNLVERLAILHPGMEVGEAEVAAVLHGRGGAGAGRPSRTEDAEDGPELAGGAGSLSERLDAYERRLIARALEEASGNVSQASRILRTDRANLYRRMRRLGL